MRQRLAALPARARSASTSVSFASPICPALLKRPNRLNVCSGSVAGPPPKTQGMRSTEQLHEELRGSGYRGSLRTLRRPTARLRQDTAVPEPPPAPAARKAASWILTPAGRSRPR